MTRFASLWFLAFILAEGSFGYAQGNTKAQTQTSPSATKITKPPQKKNSPIILVDTDEACTLNVDGDDKGLISPSESKKISVTVGEHVLKCAVENEPDMVWRKVVDVKGPGQVAAMVALKSAHLQYEQSVDQARREKEKAEAAAEAVTQAAEQKRRALEANKEQVLGRLRQMQGEWHSDTKDNVYYGRGCQAKKETHLVFTISSIDGDSGMASGTYQLDSSRAPTTVSSFLAGMNHSNCLSLDNGEAALSFVSQTYETRISCGTDVSLPCRAQAEATSCEPQGCKTSYSFNVEVQDGELLMRFADTVLTFSRQ